MSPDQIAAGVAVAALVVVVSAVAAVAVEYYTTRPQRTCHECGAREHGWVSCPSCSTRRCLTCYEGMHGERVELDDPFHGPVSVFYCIDCISSD